MQRPDRPANFCSLPASFRDDSVIYTVNISHFRVFMRCNDSTWVDSGGSIMKGVMTVRKSIWGSLSWQERSQTSTTEVFVMTVRGLISGSPSWKA